VTLFLMFFSGVFRWTWYKLSSVSGISQRHHTPGNKAFSFMFIVISDTRVYITSCIDVFEEVIISMVS